MTVKGSRDSGVLKRGGDALLLQWLITVSLPAEEELPQLKGIWKDSQNSHVNCLLATWIEGDHSSLLVWQSTFLPNALALHTD